MKDLKQLIKSHNRRWDSEVMAIPCARWDSEVMAIPCAKEQHNEQVKSLLLALREGVEEKRQDTLDCGAWCHCSSHSYNDCISDISTLITEAIENLTKE